MGSPVSDRLALTPSSPETPKREGLMLNNEYTESFDESNEVQQLRERHAGKKDSEGLNSETDSIEEIYSHLNNDSNVNILKTDKSQKLSEKEIKTLKSTLNNFQKQRFDNQKQNRFKPKYKNGKSVSYTIFDAPYFKESEFYGFYIIFWLGTGFSIFNAVVHHYFNKNETFLDGVIIKLFKQDLLNVFITEALMYFSMFGITSIQALIKYRIIGWYFAQYIQVAYTLIYAIFWWVFINERSEFPWIARIFLVLNLLVYTMKIHSYGFYNIYLWSIYAELRKSQKYIHNLELEKNADQEIEKLIVESLAFCTFELEYQARVTSLDNDVEALTKKIIGDIVNQSAIAFESKDPNHFPNNLTLLNYFLFTLYPTVVYTLNFPRTDKIRWKYVFEKVCGIFGIIILMIIVAENFMVPLVLRAIEIRKLPISERLVPFLLILLDMIPPFLFQYIFTFFLIWDQILNAIGEISRFADRDFYGPWWSSSDWFDFARLWNKPVHNFLLRHVYHSSISSISVSKNTANFLTFVISSVIHELAMMSIFNNFRGYLFFFQMSQIPLVMISRTRWLRDQNILGILICWIGFMTGPLIICTLYLVY